MYKRRLSSYIQDMSRPITYSHFHVNPFRIPDAIYLGTKPLETPRGDLRTDKYGKPPPILHVSSTSG